MKTGIFQQRLVSWLLKASRRPLKGFTLIELLVSIIISSIVVSALLYLVTELNRFNGREELLTDTQQSMRRALDFMASDVSEASFVYTEPAADIIADLRNDPKFPDADEATPILAFWRLDPVNTETLDCTDWGGATPPNPPPQKRLECDALRIRHSTYTLVVYLQTFDNEDSDIWRGPTRIIRYELSKYKDGGVDDLDIRNGYLDPTVNEVNAAGDIITFANWEASGTTLEGVAQVLTDHVAALQEVEGDGVPTASEDCPTTASYTRTPANSNNFYVCIQDGAAGTTATGFGQNSLLNRTNQSLIINLTGNASRNPDGNDILVGSGAEASRLPSLSSELLLRGVIDKPR